MIKLEHGEKTPFTGVLLSIDEADHVEKLILKYEKLKLGFEEYTARNYPQK